jgi:hypothetical protein
MPYKGNLCLNGYVVREISTHISNSYIHTSILTDSRFLELLLCRLSEGSEKHHENELAKVPSQLNAMNFTIQAG